MKGNLINYCLNRNDNGNRTEAPCSLYVKELQGFLSRASNQYISLFKWADIVTEWYITAADEMINFTY
jgi:hypothetical protein